MAREQGDLMEDGTVNSMYVSTDILFKFRENEIKESMLVLILLIYMLLRFRSTCLINQ